MEEKGRRNVARSSRLCEALNEELQPTDVKSWRALHGCKILHLKYDNGEMDQLPARRVEPEEYLPPSIGSRVCCKVKGAKYSAEIVAIEITTPTKNMPPASNKRKVETPEILDDEKAVKKCKKDLQILSEKSIISSQLNYFESKKESVSSRQDKQPENNNRSLSETEIRSIFKEEVQLLLENMVPKSQCITAIEIEHLLEEKLQPIQEKLSTCVEKCPLTPPVSSPIRIPSPLAPSDTFNIDTTSPHDTEDILRSPLDLKLQILKPTLEEQLGVQAKPQTSKPVPPHFKDEYVELGEIKVPAEKLRAAAKKAPTAYRMGRKLLPNFFSSSELKTCTCVPPKPGAKIVRPSADMKKIALLLGEVRKVFPSGWDEAVMYCKLNQGFIDYRNKH